MNANRHASAARAALREIGRDDLCPHIIVVRIGDRPAFVGSIYGTGTAQPERDDHDRELVSRAIGITKRNYN